jgi:cytochrome c2
MRALLLYFALAGLTLTASQLQTPDPQRGKAVFQACRDCHNVLTDARKAGPSLRTLFGKVRLVNGKRAMEQNVAELIIEGYNGMPSYRHMFRPDDWNDLLSYLKTLRARPEIGPVLKPIRGSDEEILSAGKKNYAEHCGSCHDAADSKVPELLRIYTRDTLSTGEPVKEATIVPRVRDGHAGAPALRDVLDDAALFSLMAFLKAQ